MLFFEKALSLLRPGGRLVFITPEKYLYVQSAEALRRLLAGYAVEELEFVDERAFGDVLAYPLITVVRKAPPYGPPPWLCGTAGGWRYSSRGTGRRGSRPFWRERRRGSAVV